MLPFAPYRNGSFEDSIEGIFISPSKMAFYWRDKMRKTGKKQSLFARLSPHPVWQLPCFKQQDGQHDRNQGVPAFHTAPPSNGQARESAVSGVSRTGICAMATGSAVS